MFRAYRLRSTIAISTTFLFVSLGFEIRNRIWPVKGSLGWSVWLLAFFFGVSLVRHGTDWLWKLLVHLRCVRKLILGGTWLEGIWFINTVGYIEGKPLITQVGIAEFSYQLPDLTLECRVSSIIVPSGDVINTKVSSILLDDKLNYMHLFTRNVRNVKETGAAYGDFYCDAGRPPEHYEGGVVILNSQEGHNRRQTGVKLSDDEVCILTQKYHAEWRQGALHDSEWVNSYCKQRPPVNIA